MVLPWSAPRRLGKMADRSGRTIYTALGKSHPDGGSVDMDVSVLLVFAGTLVVSAGSPGPSIAALVSRVLTRGFRDVLPFLAAMWLGEVLWLTLAVAGLTAIAESFHLLFVAIKWAGIAYLLY